jgi:hypothetical protein
MNETTLNPGETTAHHPKNWVRGAALGLFSLGLVLVLGLVFTRVIAARVPEQRATLEKLITDRTGLAVRFDNVHFAWDLKGTSAVFERVELTDPGAGRVRVVAPELRVEFDTWNFLRHREFSFGRVTLASPDIEIHRDAAPSSARAVAPRESSAGAAAASEDEAALLQRHLGWAEQMPVGRIEVENARVHLVERAASRRGTVARQSFTLSSAIVSRGPTTFNAYGTMLLAQDVGQSLFVSAKLEGLGAAAPTSAGLSGDLRVIARRILLERLPEKSGLANLRGRGTLDAKVHLRDGRIDGGSWQASGRELAFEGGGARFDHVSFNGELSRDAVARGDADLLFDVTDLQVTRGARLERAPKFAARLSLAPGARVARTRVTADRVPFMAGELLAGVFADASADATAARWTPVAGELRDLRFDSGERDDWALTARIAGADFTRAADRSRLTQVFAELSMTREALELRFDPAAQAVLRLADREPRPIAFAGAVALDTRDANAWRFREFSLHSGTTTLAANGEWNVAAPRATPLAVSIEQVDRALLGDAWTLIAPGEPAPELLANVAAGSVESGQFELLPVRREDGAVALDWRRSSGKLLLAGLESRDAPKLAQGRGTLDFARGGAVLRLAGGKVEDLDLKTARLDWPRDGEPRLRASLDGALSTPLLRETLAGQGLERLAGRIAFDTDVRGEKNIRDPGSWRVTARVSEATVPLAGGLPPVAGLSGTLRYSERQLRTLELAGEWFDGPVEIAARRATPRAALSFAVEGKGEVAPLLRALGQDAVADRVRGTLGWSGTVQRVAGDADGWQIRLESSLAGVESKLPAPFAKTRARSLPVTAQLRVDSGGVRDYSVDGRDFTVRGSARDGANAATFDVQGVAGEMVREAGADPSLRIAKLDARRAAGVFAVAAAMLPANGDVTLAIGELGAGGNSLGALEGSLSRRDSGLRFVVESAGDSPHRVSLDGSCAEAQCRATFVADTSRLAPLVRDAKLPAEWPTASMHAKGELRWPFDAAADFARTLAGEFEIESQGVDGGHTLNANATIENGQVRLADLQGSGPGSGQVFRGSGRVGLVERDYDVSVDYEQVALAATAVPTPARARLARAWSVLRGSAAKQGWTEAAESKRLQWHGYWD